VHQKKMGSPKRRRDSRTPPPPGDDRRGRSRSRERARLDSKGSGGRRDDPADLDWNKSTQQFLKNLSSSGSSGLNYGSGSGRSSRQDGGYGSRDTAIRVAAHIKVVLGQETPSILECQCRHLHTIALEICRHISQGRLKVLPSQGRQKKKMKTQVHQVLLDQTRMRNQTIQKLTL